MRTWITVSAAVLVALTPTLAPGPAAAVPNGSAWGSTPAVTVVRAATASQTNSEAVALRRDVAATLQRYLTDYGGRFTEAEKRQLIGYKANADRHLAAVVAATQRFALTTTNGSSLATRRAAGKAAQTAWQRAKAASDATFESARRIMEPKLSVFERLQALRDYDDMNDRFDALGTHINEAVSGLK